MPYGEPQIETSNVTYRVKLVHTASNGYLEVVSGTQVDSRDELVTVAVQSALDVLTANGFTLDQATKTSPATQTITPTPPEE